MERRFGEPAIAAIGSYSEYVPIPLDAEFFGENVLDHLRAHESLWGDDVELFAGLAHREALADQGLIVLE
jgi:hypothetical protein